MSGAEVLGIVLGVLPLLISALEHYEDTIRPIKTYRSFTTKAHQFFDQLETQRTIFRAECELLLSAVTDSTTAREMLMDPNHEKWKSEAIRDLFGRRMGSLGTACSLVISNMNKKLIEIGSFSQSFNDIPVSSPKTRDWVKRVRTKLKLTLSEPKLRESITELDTLNTTFRTLSSQVVRFEDYASNHEKISESSSNFIMGKKAEDLKKFQAVRIAARLLYEALARACTIHTEHFAKFCLQVRYLEGGGNGTIPSQVRFNLTFSHLKATRRSSLQSKSASQILRFEVESLLGNEQSICDFCESKKVNMGVVRAVESEQLSNEGKRKETELPIAVPASIQLSRTSSKGKRKAAQETSATSITTRTAEQLSSIETLSLKGKQIQRPEGSESSTLSRSLCSDLQESHNRSGSSSPATYVAMLERSTTSNHLIYYPAQSDFSQSDDPSISLSQMLAPMSGGIPQYLRLSIARSLSVAVLQFHTTPWFESSWQSENICFFEDRSRPGFPVVQLPHLIVHMTLDENNAGTSTILSRPPGNTNLAPNNVLFTLGIMLLELAYNTPFHTLIVPDDLEVSPDKNAVQFFAARRLADNVGVHLGARYARLVKKCLRCDFGSGEDLDTVELQERLYEDVICQLDRLEQGFRQLQTDE